MRVTVDNYDGNGGGSRDDNDNNNYGCWGEGKDNGDNFRDEGFYSLVGKSK